MITSLRLNDFKNFADETLDVGPFTVIVGANASGKTYFHILARERGVADGLGGGREVLGEEAARHISAIRSKCPEDFDALAKRLTARL